MREAYRAGRDLHTETAALMTGVALGEVTKEARTSAKVANFGLLYGAGPATLQKQAVAQYGLDMELDEARQIVEGFRAAYPTLYAWQQSEGTKTTKAVNTAIGRRRMLVGFNDKYTTRINTQVQGTAGDIAKIAIDKLWRHVVQAPAGEAKLIAMVHDEIVLEVREERAEHWAGVLKESMELAGSEVCTHVPIVAEVSSGKTWADAK
jgi:DNA polymerase-1